MAYFDSTNIRSDQPNALIPLPADPATGSFLSYKFLANMHNKSYSAFGQVRWKLLDPLEFSAGLRYSHDERSGQQQNVFLHSFFSNPAGAITLAPAGEIFAGKRNYGNFSPELTLSWTPVHNTLFYGSYKTGYKAGAASSSNILPANYGSIFTATNGDSLFYKPEHIKGFELGAKTQLLDNRLRLTGSLFTYKYTDLQVQNFDSKNFIVEALNVVAWDEGYRA